VVGLFAYVAAFRAGAAGTVVAVEPDPWLAGLLRRSQRDLPATQATVTVVEAAISDRVGVASFGIAARGRAASHLSDLHGSTQAGGIREVIDVATITLDRLLDAHRPPLIVKIDVEGAELLCLQGADRLLATWRPHLLCEVGQASRREVGELLRARSYVITDASKPPGERIPLAEPPWSMLAVPS